ncbi:MAG: galactonate dehydratase [Chloroflexota bacterium]|nr:galactonate dehydratase [Chloroflexota bacterium]
MKITNVECLPVLDGRNCVFVVVETDEGLFGVGEAGLTRRAHAIAAVVDDFATLLVGQDPLRIEHHWQQLSRGFFFPHDKIAGSALAAVDIALWDLMGKALNVPVYQLLGGRVRDRVVCYPHMGGRTPEELVERCLAAREEGWKFVRFSPNIGPDSVFEPAAAIRESVNMFEAVREALGDTVEICFDIHTRLDPADAIQLCRAVEPYRPFFMEDPIRSEGSNSFRLLRQHINVPLAAGEQYCSKWEFRQLIEEDLIDYARVDLCICGGLSESKKVAAMAETHYIKLATHNPLGPVSSAACLHLNLACSNVGVMEQPQRPGRAMTNVVPGQVTWEDGYLLPPTKPGLGIEFDRDAARRMPYQAGGPSRPLLHREDGSFTNW